MLRAHDIDVFEVNRPDRSRRRLRGKSDPTDAESAARAVLAGEANAVPKTQSGAVEAMRVVCMARRSAVKARRRAVNQLRALLVTAPDVLRSKLLRPKPEQCVRSRLALQPTETTPLLRALIGTLRLLAKRWTNLTGELRELDAALRQLTQHAVGGLIKQFRPAHCRRPRARVCGTGSTAAVTVPPTTRCGRLRWCACTASLVRDPMWHAVPRKACLAKRSSAA